MMAKWNWGGEYFESDKGASLRDRAGGPADLSRQLHGVSTEGAHPLRGDDLWSDEIEALIDAGFATVSRNPSDHETAVAYRRTIAGLLARIEAARHIIEYGYPGQPAKHEQCPHGQFGFEDCVTCYDEALLAALDCDSGRLPKGEDAPAAECEASQSGAVKQAHRPENPAYFWLGIQAEGRE